MRVPHLRATAPTAASSPWSTASLRAFRDAAPMCRLSAAWPAVRSFLSLASRCALLVALDVLDGGPRTAVDEPVTGPR